MSINGTTSSTGKGRMSTPRRGGGGGGGSGGGGGEGSTSKKRQRGSSFSLSFSGFGNDEVTGWMGYKEYKGRVVG